MLGSASLGTTTRPKPPSSGPPTPTRTLLALFTTKEETPQFIEKATGGSCLSSANTLTHATKATAQPTVSGRKEPTISIDRRRPRQRWCAGPESFGIGFKIAVLKKYWNTNAEAKAVRLFLYILISAFAGTAILLTQFIVGPRLGLQLVGNAVFFLGLAGAVACAKRTPLDSPRALVLAPAAYVVATLVLGVMGVFAYDVSRTATILLMGPMALGWVPSAGPDAPIFQRFPIWVLSTLVLIGSAITLGALLRKLRERRGNGAEG